MARVHAVHLKRPPVTADGLSAGSVSDGAREGRASVPARDDVRETETVDAVSAAARVRELELQVDRLAQANRQLAEREASLRAIFDAGPDAVALVGRDGTILDLNPAGRDLIELDASFRPIGVRLDMLATDPHRTACRSLAARVFRGEAATVELEIQGLRGRRRWIEIHATPLRGDDGTCRRWSASAATSRRGAPRGGAARPRGAVARRLRVADGRHPVLGSRRRDHRRQRRLPAAGRLLARGSRRRPRLVVEMTPLEERHLDERALESLSATGFCAPYEKHYIRKDGSRIPIVIGAALVDGSRDHGVAFVQDITARREAEARLRESEARFRNMAEHSPLILWMVDAEAAASTSTRTGTTSAACRPAALSARGSSPRCTPTTSRPSGRRSRARSRRARAIATKLRVRRRDGVYRHMIDNASPRFGPNGEFLGLIGVLIDIQDLKDAEEARQRLEAPLRQAQKMEALGTLAGGVAHDFNNILGTIIGNVELAREDLVAEHPAQESLAEVEKASARARELVQQILTFGRRQPDERRVIGLREVVEESVRLLRATLPAGIELVTGFARDVPNVLADPLAHPPGGDEPLHQRVAGDSRRRRPDHGVAGDGARHRRTGPGRTAARPLRLPHGRRHRLRHRPGHRRAHLRSVLHHQAAGRRHRPRPVGGRRDRQEPRRRDRGRDDAGAGRDLPRLLPGRRGRGGAARHRAAAGPQGRGQRVLYLDDEASLVHLTSRLLGRAGYEVEGFTRPAEASPRSPPIRVGSTSSSRT